MKRRHLAACVAAIAAALLASGCATAPQSGTSASANVSEGAQSMKTITVSTSKMEYVVPDRASFSMAAIAQAKTSEEANAKGAEIANALIARMKELGVDEKNIQTNYVDLSPIYGQAQEEPVADDGAATVSFGTGSDIVGYEMRTNITVKDIAIEEVGAFISEAVASGASSVDGPLHYVSSYDEAYERALTGAIQAARKKAEVMAKAAGVNLGDVVSMNESYQNTAYRAEVSSAMGAMDSMAEESAIEVAPGEVGIEAQVTVSYEIR